METKVCTKCGVEYPATKEFFHADKSRKYGLYSMCKKCKRLKLIEWNKNNPEKVGEVSRKWRQENPEKAKANAKKWYAANTEKKRAKISEWKSKNPEKVKASIKKWRAANPEKYAYIDTKRKLKKQIGATPPPELVEIKVLINKTKKLCKTLNN